MRELPGFGTHRRGDERLCASQRLSRSRAGAAAAGAGRHDRGLYGAIRRADGAVRARRGHGGGPGDRPVAARADGVGAGARGGDLSRSPARSRSAPAAPRTPLAAQCLPSRDGKYVAVSGSTPQVARRVFEIIGRPEMIDDPRFADQLGAGEASRAGRRGGGGLVRAARPRRGAAHHARRRARRWARSIRRPTRRTIRISTSAAWWSMSRTRQFGYAADAQHPAAAVRTPGVWRRPAPKLGAAQAEILDELGSR